MLRNADGVGGGRPIFRGKALRRCVVDDDPLPKHTYSYLLIAILVT